MVAGTRNGQHTQERVQEGGPDQFVDAEAHGRLVGAEIARLVWEARTSGGAARQLAEWVDGACPVFPARPSLPAHLPPVPGRQPDRDWLQRFHLGLASMLAVAYELHPWSGMLEQATDQATEAFLSTVPDRLAG